MANAIILDGGSRIGKVSAEADDQFLIKCFFDHPALAALKEKEAPEMFLVGGTGSGKTAILRMLEHSAQNSLELDVKEMAMRYIANSDVIQFLRSIDVDLDLFFQSLWKHVLCLEFIRLKFNVTDVEGSKYAFSRIYENFFHDRSKERALSYLKCYEDKFWITMDENVREVTERLEQDVSAQLGTEISKYKSSAGYARSLSQEKKSQLQKKSQQFISPEVLSNLGKLIEMLSEYTKKDQDLYFILIDGLDESWIDEDIKYQLIWSLYSSMKGLRRITNLRIVAALRSDLVEKTFQETNLSQIQVEKFEDYVFRLKWNSNQLKELVNKRINYLFRYKYSKTDVFFEDIFTSKVNRKEKAFDFIIDRSMLRPRDFISFVNACMETAEGSSQINSTNIISAEKLYSENRRQALIGEWKNTTQCIEPLIDILKYKPKSFRCVDLMNNDFAIDLNHAMTELRIDPKDSILRMTENVKSIGGNIEDIDVFREVIQRLYLIGAIGLKINKGEAVKWFYKDQKAISKSSVDSDTTVRIHPMLYTALGIKIHS